MNQPYTRLYSTVVLMRKKRILYLPQDLYVLTLDELLDREECFSIISNRYCYRINNFQLEEPPSTFSIHIANGRFARPLTTMQSHSRIEDALFCENTDVLHNATQPIALLQIFQHNSAIFDVTKRVIQFPCRSTTIT